MGFLSANIQRPRGSAPRGPPLACRIPFRTGPRRSKIFFFDGEKRQGGYNVSQGGGVAQLGEHHVRNVGVEGSIPFSSTIFFFSFRSSVFLIGRETIPLSRFLPGANRLPHPRTARVSRMDTGIGFRILGGNACSGGTLRSLPVPLDALSSSLHRPLRRWSPERMHPSGSIMG
jgi:hypothetical protein